MYCIQHFFSVLTYLCTNTGNNVKCISYGGPLAKGLKATFLEEAVQLVIILQ